MSLRASIGLGATVTFAVLYVAACSSYGSDDAATPTIDAGNDARTSEVADTGALPDATDVTDAGSDADASSPTFSDDFERDRNELNGPWGASSHSAGSTIALDGTQVHSGLTALHITVASSIAIDSGDALVKNFTLMGQQHAHVSFWARMSSARHAELALFSQIDTAKPNSSTLVSLTNDEKGVELGAQLNGGSSVAVSSVALPLNVWHGFDLTFGWSGIELELTLAIDGVTVDKSKLASSVETTNFQIELGPESVEDGVAYEVWYDDVVVELTP